MTDDTEDGGDWKEVTEEDKELAKENFKGFVVLVGILAVILVGASMIGGSAGETVVDRENYERVTDSFEAEQGDQIKVNIENTATGLRTHVAIESPSGEIVLSEGVQDEASYEVGLEESGEYTVRMDPPDSSPTTSGSVEVVILDSGGD